MKKRVIAALLCLPVALSLVSCSSGGEKSTESSSEVTSADLVVPDYNALDYVTLGDYRSISVDCYGHYDITEDDVIDSINSDLESYAVFEKNEKDKKVDDGDWVNIDFTGSVDGTEFDGGSYEGFDLEIGSGTFLDGFESSLIGCKVGDDIDVSVTFPEDYGSEELNGKDAVFSVHINYIENKIVTTYDTLTDKYCEDNTDYDTVDEYYAAIKIQLDEDAADEKLSDSQEAILNKLKEISTVNGYPENLVEKAYQDSKEDFLAFCETYGFDSSDYIATYYTEYETEDEFYENLREQAADGVDDDLLLRAVAETEGFTVDEDGFNDYVEDICSNNGYDDSDSLFEQYGEDYVRNIYLLYDVTLNWLVENVDISFHNTVSDSGISLDDLIE